jgi:tRNA (uracil-5-)-methyltransferase TRM9
MKKSHNETKGVMESYDRIAEEFQHTRRTPWPSLKELGDCEGKAVLDLGAGTGRNSKALVAQGASIVVAADLSFEMLRVIKRNSPTGGIICPLRCNAMNLPFKPGIFDRVAFVATIHNIPQRENREAAMVEVARVMAIGGRAVVTAWSRTQSRFLKSGSSFLLEWLKGGEVGDIHIRWGNYASRFYHLFTKAELKGTVGKAGLSITRAYGEKVSRKIFPENWVIVAEKVPING